MVRIRQMCRRSPSLPRRRKRSPPTILAYEAHVFTISALQDASQFIPTPVLEVPVLSPQPRSGSLVFRLVHTMIRDSHPLSSGERRSRTSPRRILLPHSLPRRRLARLQMISRIALACLHRHSLKDEDQSQAGTLRSSLADHRSRPLRISAMRLQQLLCLSLRVQFQSLIPGTSPFRPRCLSSQGCLASPNT